MADDTGLLLYSVLRPLAQPLIGAFHGWFATRMVVVMLFRPYKAYYWPGTKTRIPFTPGIFPNRKPALARNIAPTVTETLLTPADIQEKADHYLTEESVTKGVDTIIGTMLQGLSHTDRLALVANELRKLVPDLLATSAQSLLKSLTAEPSPLLHRLTGTLIRDGLMHIRFSEQAASELIDYLFRTVFTPAHVRDGLYQALTPERAHNLQNVLRTRTTGALKLILSFVNIEGVFLNLKEYLQNEPEKSETMIAEVMEQLHLREELIARVMALDFRKLSYEDIELLQANMERAIQNYLNHHQDSINQTLGHFEGVIGDVIDQKVRTFDPTAMRPELRALITQEVARFLHRYLKADLGNMVHHSLLALKPGEMIIAKVEAYSSQDIENLILGIMKRELANLELLGLLIGVLLGISALGIEYFLPIR